MLIRHPQGDSHLTLTQEASQTGTGSTKNTIPDSIDCMYSHQPHQILSKRDLKQSFQEL